MNRANKVVEDYRAIRQDFAFDPSIMNDEDERVRRLKEIINNRLSVVDKTIILLYVSCQSYRKLGRQIGLSHMTVRKEVLRIKNIILQEYTKQ